MESVIYLAEWHDTKDASGSCLFTSSVEAIKWAISSAILMGKPDWDRFPDPERGDFPYADMDGSREDLSPLFRITWPGGFATVDRRKTQGEFRQTADWLMDRTNEVYGKIVAQRDSQSRE